jgi:hypothetical protein
MNQLFAISQSRQSENMIEKLESFLLRIYFLLFRKYLSWILKIQRQQSAAVLFKAYIHTFFLYPDKQLKYNSDLAQAVRYKILDTLPNEDNEDLNQGEIDELYKVVSSDESIRTVIKNYYLIESFYCTFSISSEVLKEKSDCVLLRFGTTLQRNRRHLLEFT